MDRTIERTDVGYRHLLPNLRWGAIVAGVVCALAIQVTLGLFGAGIGFSARPAANTTIGLSAAIWSMCIPLIACLVGAWLCVRLAGTVHVVGSFVHGLLVWGIGLLCGALFLSGLMLGGMLPNFRAALSTPQVQAILRNPTLRSFQIDQFASRAAFGAVAAGVSSLLGLIGALCGAAAARYAMQQDLRRGAYRPTGTYRREEDFMPHSTPVRGDLGDELPPDVPRH